MKLGDVPFEDEVGEIADKAKEKASNASGGIPFEDEVAADGGGVPFEDEVEEPQKSADYGVMQRQRDTVVAETGEADTDAGTAFLQNVLPGAMNEAKKERDFKISNLERLRSGAVKDEIAQKRKDGKIGIREKHRNEGRLRHGIAGEISDIGAGGIAETQEGLDMLREAGGGSAWEGFKRGIKDIFGIENPKEKPKAQPGEEPEEETENEREASYFDQIESVAKNAGIDEKRIGELRKSSKTVEDFADGLRDEAVKSLSSMAQNRKGASERLQKFKASTTDSVLNGLITNAGYTGQFILASLNGPMGYGYQILDSAEQRRDELMQADYDVAQDGSLVIRHTEDSVGAATTKGLLGGATEVAVEIALDKGLGWIFGGMKIPLGKGKSKVLAPWLGKTTDAVVGGAVKRPMQALGRVMSKNPAGKWLVGAAQGFGRYSKITGVHGIPMEMLEEHVQSFADDVIGFGTKGRDYGGLGAEASEWWDKKFWNYESNRDIFLGLVGTMAVQGVYAGTKAHHDIAKWRQDKAGFLKTVIDPKKVDALSDTEISHLYNLVSSPNFTKDRVERFLSHVQKHTELANAVLQLREANTPFFETDKDALKQAVESGSIKSQFVPPTRAVEGGRMVDWQPYTWKDGRRTLRVYDPNTGIAIDQMGGRNNHLVVTNRDGVRIEVAADESGDAFLKAMNVADRMSIHNQLLDAKRPMKQAYVENRIETLFPKGNFRILANNAELLEKYPGIEKTEDYNPQNPAFTAPDGNVIIVLDNLRTAQEANRMILHEAAIHSGLKEKFTAEQKRKFLQNIDDPKVNAFKNRLMRIRGVDSWDKLGDKDIEEAFAHAWDRRRTNPLLTQKIGHALREMGRAVGLPISYNTSDLEVMVDSLQRDGQKGKGSVSPSDFDTTEHANSVPYNEAQRDFSGDVADISAPAEETEEKKAVRQIERIDRIKQNHPRMWEYAMRVNDGDEDAAAEFISKALEEEGRRGVAGEAEHGMHALEVAAKLENGEDLTPADIEILDEHGFTGAILYADYGYRKQKNGTWRHVGTTNKQEKPNETRNGADEAQAQPAEGAERPAEPETPRPAETGEAPAQSAGVVEKPAESSEAKPESVPPADERTLVDRLSQNGGVLGETPMAELAYDETLKPNFKEGANPETGEVSPIDKPIRAMMPPIVVYEFDKPRVGKDGKPVKKIVGTGVHRYQAAKRAGWESIPTVTLREADGFSIDDIMSIDAISNILDEKGSVNDYIKFLNSTKPTREEAESSGLLDRPKGKTAFLIYESATDDTRAATDFEGSGESGKITPEQAGIIADAAPKQAALQRILVRKALDGVRGKKLAILARSLAEEAKNRKNAPKVESGTQLDLFTSEEDVALLQQEEKRADYRAKKANDYNRIAENLRTALRKGGRLDLNKDYAKELGITDPKDRKQIAAARDKAVERANYWENAIQLDPADKAAMDAELGIESAKPGLQLESPTAEQLAEEERKRREKEAIKNGQEKPIKGSGAVNVQPEMDLGQTGQQDLFSPIVPNEGNAQKPAENVATGAPQKAEATTPMKAEKPMEGRKSGDTGASNGSVTPENSIFGNDKESEQAFTDALDAMWFSRELENGADDDFEFVNVSKAPFNNVDAAVAWAKSNGIVGKMTDEETGGKGDISISETSIREMLNPAQVEKSASRDAHFAVITKLRNVIAASHIEEVHPDYKKGKDGKRSPANGINPGVTIVVAYAAVDFGGTPMRAKITLKKFADKNTLPKAYAYHVAQIEVLTGNLVHPRKNGTAPRANTSIRRDILLKGVTDVNGVPLLRPNQSERATEVANALEDSESEANAVRKNKTPKKTKRTFKLFRKFANGTYGALFIDSANRLVPGEWYYARSPEIGKLKQLEGAQRDDRFKWGKVYLLDADNNATPIDKMPNVGAINAATAKGKRYMAVALGSKGQKLFYNLGINGSGSVAGFAFRPGWHSTNAPSAGHIGPSYGMKGKVAATGQNHYRSSDQVWCEIEIPDDIDYNPSAMARAPFLKEKGRELEKNRKEAQLDYIPFGGSYFYRTNSNADEKQDWVISGAVRIVRELSREEVNRYNRENGFTPDAPIADTREQAAEKQNATPNDVNWFSRELDEHTDEEREAHNLLMGVKAIRAFAKSGGKAFGDFAATVKAYRPAVYERIKAFMPGMWLNARLGGLKDLQERTEAQYQAALDLVDQGYTYDRNTGSMKKPAAAPAPTAEKPTAEKPVAEKPTTKEPETPKHKTRGEAIAAAADEIAELIGKGEKFTRQDVEKVVGKHLGGSVAEGAFEMKDVTDILELAVNRFVKGKSLYSPSANVSAEAAVRVIQRIRDNILAVIPTQTTRSAKQEKMQQFSTVPHEAFVAAWVANITDNDVMLEPSAGIGGIAVFAKNAGANVILNELDPGRRDILEQLGLAPKVYGVNAEHLWAQFYAPVKKGDVKRPTVVVMNPPFSNSALTSKKDTTEIGGKHVEEALQMLAPGGRLVAIIGHGMAHDAESQKVKAWWKKIGEKYRVRADVTVNGEEYAKYGTTYDNDIIVIDKVAPDSQIKPVYGKIESIDELPAMLEGVRNDRPAIQSESVAAKPDNGGSNKGPSGRADAGQRNNGGRNGQQPGNGGNGKAEPRGGKPAGGTAGGVPDAGKDGGRGTGSNASLGVVDTVPGGLTTVETAAPEPTETNAPQEVGDGTFSTYKPAKVRIEGAKPHPTALVESTAMASVQPPDPKYSPILPKKAIESGMPSDAQLEQIVYAGQAHEQILPNGQRRGYFFGDGTGLGKGTEIGGVISDNWNHGRRKAVWVSKESGLLQDAMRDLVTYGLDGQIFSFDPKKKSVTGRETGIAFLSYDGLRSDCVFDTEGKVRSAKQGQKNRFQHLVEWLGKDFDGVIVFDEAHKAGNAVPTRGKRGQKPASKQALAVVALQEALPNARILYVSATGATEVSNLSYATRLGLWGKGTAFRDRQDFISRVSAGGLSVMEIVARDMKSMGVYMARSLSYDGIVNRKIEHALSPDQKRKYDEMADAWQMVITSVGDALIATNGAGNSNAVSAAMSALWSGEQRFFNQLLTAMQMPSIIADAKRQLEAGNSVVFQLVNTNEATQKRAIEAQRQRDGEVNAEELDLSPRDIIIGYVRNSFPTAQYVEQEDEDGNTQYVVLTDADGKPVENPVAVEARDELLEKLNMMKLDDNPLELIIDEFGAENVAEVTGRSQRRQMVRNDDGEMEMKLVSRSKKLGLVETDEFNAGKRRVLVFSDAGGTGRSFHADKRFGNQQKRIHYLVQAGWRADAALQGFGRTHRSNEAQPPEYVLCSTDIRGHQRFISTVARRLAQLGSLTAGDRSSAGSGVFSEDDNLENQYAHNALNDLFTVMFRTDRGRFNEVSRQLGFVKPSVDRRTGDTTEVNQLIDRDGELDMTKLDIPKFLNRILNMRVDAQNALFDEFVDIMRDNIDAAKEAGTFDPGLEKLQGDKIEELNRTELWSGGNGTGSTDIVEVGVSKKSRKVDYETVLARMQRAADGRGWFFARNLNSGKIFGFAETARAKTLPSGLVVNQLRCFTPDGKAPLVPESDVRFDGPHVNFQRVSEKDAAGLWGAALAEIPDLDTTKRYFVHGTMLPIWDRLAVQNPRIFRIAPEGKGSFLGMEVKAENVNDLLRRFGKAAQSVELTPDAVLNRIVKEGKKVPLVQTGWELKRSRVNGDYRIELTGPEDRKTLERLALDGLGTYEKIGYVPRFFIPRTVDGLKKFLDAYPAMPEDGGIGTVASTGVDYASLSHEDRQRAFSGLLQKYIDAYERSGSSQAISDAADALDNIIVAMQTDELGQIFQDFRQYDTGPNSAMHMMLDMVDRELKNRLLGVNHNNSGQWYSRDLEEAFDDELSSIAIHEVNAWRAARGLPQMPKRAKTTVDDIIKAGKYMASNADEMERFLKVSAETPHNWTAVEVSAVAQRRLVLEQDYDEKTRLINVAEMNGNREEAQHIREARDLVQEQIDVMDRAINKAKREWGLSGLARRFMLNRDGTFARFSGELQSIVGRKLTEAEEQGAQALWNAYREAQGKLDDETIAKTAELLKDIVRKHLAREEQQHRTGKGRPLSVIEKEYQQALDHILVHANRAGGVLMGLPDGRKWIDAIRRYHMAAAIETGRHLDVNEMLEKIHADIDGMVKADDHDIMQMITGHGNTYEADNSELEKALREQRRLMNEYQKWEDMLSEGHLPDKTGIIRDEPTQKEREVQRTTRELMREFMQAHPELLQMDASKRLKTIQDSLMKRWKNEIEDLQKAVANDERIIRQKNTMTYTPEMVERRRQLEEWRQRYREAFPPEPLTHEQKVARILRALQGRLAKLEEKKAALEGAATDADRESVLAKRKTEEVKDPQLDAIRKQIADVQAEIQDLHDINFPEGTTEEFQAMLKTRRTALERNIQRIQTLLLNRDFSPQKREPSALAKRVAADPEIMELTKTRNAAAKRLMQERERYRRSTRPFAKARDWIEVLAASPRIFRTMLDLSATFTQGAALFAGHPKLGLQALKDSIRTLYSEKNTDEIMAAMVADPEFQDYIDAGGHVYYVSDVTEKGVPEEFRGVSQKLRAFGKEFSLEDAHIPFMSIFTKDGTTPDWAYVVKGSERSFGTFLNSIGFSVFKAIKNSGGWGPTGPTRSQLKDLALSINVALGRGYESKGAKGFWDTMSSFAFWAPRFWISGAKMAIGWNVWRPLVSGDTVEFTMAERKMAAKNAAKEWVRQMTGMLAFNLLVTLLMGRKDPEWLSEFFDPRSTHFMAARIGNSNVSFFGAARQWITFMARLAFGEKRGIDGTVKKVDRGSVTWNFLRSKSSPLFGLGWDLLSQKTFIGEKLKWDGSAKGDKEKGGWWHVAESLGVPLSVNDTIDVWKKNSMANALMITPFAVTGALKNTYELNEYDRAVNPYKIAVREIKNAWKEKRSEDAKRIMAENPELGQMARIDSLIKTVDFTRKWISDIEKAGKTPSDDLMRKFRFQQQAVVDAIREARKQ